MSNMYPGNMYPPPPAMQQQQDPLTVYASYKLNAGDYFPDQVSVFDNAGRYGPTNIHTSRVQSVQGKFVLGSLSWQITGCDYDRFTLVNHGLLYITCDNMRLGDGRLLMFSTHADDPLTSRGHMALRNETADVNAYLSLRLTLDGQRFQTNAPLKIDVWASGTQLRGPYYGH